MYPSCRHFRTSIMVCAPVYMWFSLRILKNNKFSANNRLCRPVTMTCCSTRWRDSFRQSAVNSRCSLTRLTSPTVQLPQSSIDWSAFRAFKSLRVSSADGEQKIGDSFTETWSCYKVLRGERCIHSNRAPLSADTVLHLQPSRVSH